MKDKRILAVREKVFEIFGIAGDKLQSADILYESEKYRESIPLFRDSALYGIKALLMLWACFGIFGVAIVLTFGVFYLATCLTGDYGDEKIEKNKKNT